MTIPRLLQTFCLLVVGVSTAFAKPPAWAGKPDKVLSLKALPGQMKFDESTLSVKTGQKVKLTISNPDDLQHNFVLLDQDSKDPLGEEFAKQCIALGARGTELAWTIESPRVLAKSGMINLKEAVDVYFEAPKKAGDYLFLCTFPGHSILMRGILEVSDGKSPFSKLTYTTYDGEFSKLPDFSRLEPKSTHSASLIGFPEKVENPERIAVVWEGTFRIPKTGEWRFFLGSDDGSRLAIDGENVVNNDGLHSFRFQSKKEKLLAGTHTMRVDYFNSGGPGKIVVYAKLKGQKDLVFSKTKSKPKKGKKPPPKPIYLKPENPGEAIVHRTFIKGTQPRAIAVGYPHGLNLSWNADTMNLDLMWRGKFVNVAPHWIGRGSQSAVAGFDQTNPVEGMVFQTLESMDQPWIPYSQETVRYERDTKPEDIKKTLKIGVPHPDYDFKGYRLDQQRFPTFFYRFKGMNVSDTFSVRKLNRHHGYQRTLTIEGSVPEKTFMLLSTTGKYQESSDGWISLSKLLSLKVAGAEPVIRTAKVSQSSKTRKELVLPITQAGEVQVAYRWETPPTQAPRK